MPNSIDQFDELLAAFDADPLRAGVRQDVKERRALARQLRTLRKNQKPKLTQKKLAKQIDLSQATISDFESGEADPRISRFQRYARALDLRARIVLTRVFEDGVERIVWSDSPDLCSPIARGGYLHVNEGTMVDSSGAVPIVNRQLDSTDGFIFTMRPHGTGAESSTDSTRIEVG